MKVLVTGATGFLGREVVPALLDRGHQVACLVRPARSLDDLEWTRHEGVTLIRGDLRQRGPWMSAIGGCDAVVHLAAATSGGYSEQFAATVVATENLLAALDGDPPRRLVHISSFSVYDYSTPKTGSPIDERSPLEEQPMRRDAYTRCKLLQEQMVRDHAEGSPSELVVLRPGAIYGPSTEWDHGIAARIGRVGLIFAPGSSTRLIEVSDCARAIAAAVDVPAAAGRTLDLVDSQPPTHLEYFLRCRALGGTDAIPIQVPWTVVDALGRVIRLIDRVALGSRAKLPELLEHRRQQARWRDFTYPNALARSVLEWSPAVSLDEGIQRMIAARPRR